MATFETPDQPKAIHHGHNIRRFREVRLWKQEQLAAKLGPDWTQKRVSMLESTENVEAELLKQVADALNVSPELIEKFSDDSINQYFNNFNGEHSGTQAFGTQCTYNLADKYVETVEKNEKLYKELLRVEREKIALLERLLEKK